MRLWVPALSIGLFFFSIFSAPQMLSWAEDRPRLPEQILREKSRAEALKRNLQREREKLKGAENKERSVLAELDKIERALAAKRKALRITRERLSLTREQLKKINLRIRRLNKEIERQRERLKKRLVALYKFGREGYMNVLFSARSYFEMLNRQKYLALILDQDLRLIRDYSGNLILLERQKALATEKHRMLFQIKRQEERSNKRIEGDLKKKRALLAAIQSRKDLYRKAIKKYEEASKDLQTIIDSLEKKVRKGSGKRPGSVLGRGDFASMKGTLPFPVRGRIIKSFGIHRLPALNTYMLHKGIDIEAPSGAPIRSIFKGEVIFAGWLKGYGNTIILDHGDNYYSLAAHASRILKRVGEFVEAGEPIALVGATDSLRGPYLYFEIRHHGKPVDPLEWLASRRLSTDRRQQP